MKTATATLAQLTINPEINPRSAQGYAGLDGIIAQIREHGAIDHIWVRPGKKKNSFEVIDGSRRFHALQALARKGEWKKDAKIPVTVFDVDDLGARDLALAANFEREALSPADEAIAFTRLFLSGMKLEAITARYAATERLVKQRIAIGSLPEPILNALRDGRIDLGAAQHFTAVPAERALKVFKELDRKKSLRSHEVDRALRDGSVSGNDRRALFVGAVAYEAAGGSITTDLFSDNAMWSDEKLLDTLFETALQEKAQALKDEGWSFVDVIRRNTYVIDGWSRSVSKEARELTKDEKAELKKLQAGVKAMVGEHAALETKSDDEDLSDSENRRWHELDDLIEVAEARIEALNTPLYTARQMAKAGAVIAFEEHGGQVRVVRGLIKPGTKSKPAREDDEADGDQTETPAQPVAESADYSDAIIADLQAVAQKATKLAMILHKPALTARMGLAARIIAATEHAHGAPFRVHHAHQQSGDTFARIRDEGLTKLDGSQSFAAIVAALETFTPEEIMLIEAWLAADTFAVSSLKNTDVQAVITMIDPDMAGESWKPGAEFMGRLNRAQLTAVISDCDPTFKMPAAAKKAELVDEAAGRALATGWLPPQLRTPTYTGPGSNAWAEHLAAKSADDIAQQQAAE